MRKRFVKSHCKRGHKLDQVPSARTHFYWVKGWWRRYCYLCQRIVHKQHRDRERQMLEKLRKERR